MKNTCGGPHVVPALVLGLSPTGLVAVRSLGRKGIPVWGADFWSWQPARFSRYCMHAKQITKASKSRDADRIVEELVAFSAQHETRPVLFLANDIYIELLDGHYSILKDYYRLTTDWEQFGRRFIDKRSFYRLCQENGVLLPASRYVSNVSDVREASDKMRYPVILKPVFINHFYHVLGSQKVVRVETPEALISAFNKLQSVDPHFIVQEVIPGPERNIAVAACYFDRESRPRAIFTGRKLRQFPPGFGSASLAESDWVEEVAEESLRFLGEVGFRGLCCTEFKYDERDGDYKMIETNPRLSLWNALPVTAGVNIVYTAYQDVIAKQGEQFSVGDRLSGAAQREGCKWIFTATDVRSAFHYWSEGELSLREWGASLRGVDTEALFSRDDLKVFASGPLVALRSLVRN